MIINSVSAKNILKYRNLDLQDLPDQGIIAISGQNESGKSSIGEAVCFALFGRTFSLRQEDVGKILLWGENHCSVERPRLSFVFFTSHRVKTIAHWGS